MDDKATYYIKLTATPAQFKHVISHCKQIKIEAEAIPLDDYYLLIRTGDKVIKAELARKSKPKS